MNLQLKSLTAGVAALLFMSGIFANQALAAATPRPVITSPSTKSCAVGAVCSYTITATNSPTSYGATGLQSWQTLSTNVISGTPTAAGTFSVTVSATNAGGTGSLVVAFTVTLPPARVVVAPSGGNYTTISAAMAAINPTAANPVLIEVWPGVYNEPAQIAVKSYVHIKGSGRNVTTVQNANGAIFYVSNATKVTISDLNMSCVTTGGGVGINNSSSVTISGNKILTCGTTGVSATNASTGVIIAGNEVSPSPGNSGFGMFMHSSLAAISDNVISGYQYGIYLVAPGTSSVKNNVLTNLDAAVEIDANSSQNCAPLVSGNVITKTPWGVMVRDISCGGTITNNNIVSHYESNGTSTFGNSIVVMDNNQGFAPLIPNVSFNIVTNIWGARAVGSYNVMHNGDPILVP